MKSICVGATKGGVGKSTLAINIAIAAKHYSSQQSVLIIDTDPQGSSLSFRGLRDGDDIKVTVHNTPDLHKNMSRYEDFDLVIIDAGGREDQVFTSAIIACDFFLLPVLPGQLEIWGARDAIDVYEKVKARRPELEGRIIVNRITPNTKVSAKSLKHLKNFSSVLPTLQNAIGDRVAYIDSIELGKGVIETEPGSKASIEIKWLYKAIKKFL